jgi:hypothetical protein
MNQTKDDLINHALKIFRDNLYTDKQKFSLFYLNWIGIEHVMVVLEDSLKHGDLNQELIDTCLTEEDIEKFINNKIN